MQKCNICNVFETHRLYDLNRHEKTCRGIRRTICRYCPVYYKHKGNLEKHERLCVHNPLTKRVRALGAFFMNKTTSHQSNERNGNVLEREKVKNSFHAEFVKIGRNSNINQLPKVPYSVLVQHEPMQETIFHQDDLHQVTDNSTEYDFATSLPNGNFHISQNANKKSHATKMNEIVHKMPTLAPARELVHRPMIHMNKSTSHQSNERNGNELEFEKVHENSIVKVVSFEVANQRTPTHKMILEEDDQTQVYFNSFDNEFDNSLVNKDVPILRLENQKPQAIKVNQTVHETCTIPPPQTPKFQTKVLMKESKPKLSKPLNANVLQVGKLIPKSLVRSEILKDKVYPMQRNFLQTHFIACIKMTRVDDRQPTKKYFYKCKECSYSGTLLSDCQKHFTTAHNIENEIVLKQIEEEEVKKQKLKLFSEKLIKENNELKVINEAMLPRLTKVEQELNDTKKELNDTKKELVKTNNLLSETILEQQNQREIIILLSEQFNSFKTNEPQTK